MVKPTNTKFDFPLQKKLNEISSGVGGGGGVTDHGALTGLADDDHLLYHTDTRGDTRYYTKSQVDSSLAGKQATLVSGTNIKTINGSSVLGSGDLVVSGSGGSSPILSWMI